MVVAAVFRGDPEQVRALWSAIERNCTAECSGGVVSRDCLAHRALLDQRWLDGLLFARHIAERLRAEEFRVR